MTEVLTASVLSELYKLAKDELRDEALREADMAEYRRLIDGLPVAFIGPTWRPKTRLDTPGKYDLPERTLGWEIAGWCAKYLGGMNGEPSWKFTSEQLRFLLWWYAIDENGDFTYRTGVLQRCKGWGKDPLMAVLCIIEFVGPCRFDYWHPLTGKPVAKQCPDALVQLAAVSQDQTGNTTKVFPALMTKLLTSTYGIKGSVEVWRADEGRRHMEIVTSNPSTIQGARSTFVCLNETHEWKRGTRGVELFTTIDGNVTKVGGRYLAITNAFMPGQDSVAELMRRSYEQIRDGRAVDVGLLYDSIEADPRAPMTPEAMEIVLPKIRGDAVWLKIKDTIQSALATFRAVSQSRRMYYNQIIASEDALVSDVQWKALEDVDLDLHKGDKIVLGFDGSKTKDATALVAIRVRDMFATPLGIWEKLPGDPESWHVNRALVDAAVHKAFRTYTVLGFYADVAEWSSYVDTWHELYGEGLVVKSVANGNAIAWDMRQGGAKPTHAHMRLWEAITDTAIIKHSGHPDLRRHVLNARERENTYGMSFGKESAGSDKKIDAYAALMLAFECLHDYRTRRKPEAEPEGSEVWFL